MSIYKLINDMHAKGIELWHEDGQLKLKAPKGALTAELREQLVSNKPEIIAFLKDISATNENPPILPVSRKGADGNAIESFPLSYAQERLWFIDQMEPNSASYNIPGAVTISGELDGDHLEQAFNLIIARHENLRTIFPSQDGQAQQVILDSLDFTLERIDLSHEKTSEIRQKKTQKICRSEAQTPFDLAKGPLIRGKLFRLTEQEHLLMLNMHHIISDGWSMGVMIKEFSLIMDCLRQGQTPDQISDLPPLPIQYLDYSVWQRKLLGENRSREEGSGQGNSGKETLLEQQLAYWQEKLAGVPESLNLVTDYPRPSVQSISGARQDINLNTQLTSQLKSLTEKQGCTLFMTLLAAFKVLLYRYTGQEDICLGSPIANRQYEETESLIGMFVNTLALRSQVDGEESFIAFLAQVQNTCLDAYEHQDTPFEKIVDLVQPGRNMAVSPLYQVMFILQNAPGEALDERIHPYALDGNNTSKFDVTLELTETPKGIVGIIEYSTALFNSQTIERLIQHFIALCQAICTSPTAKISELEFIGEVEKQQLLIDYNQTQTDYPQDKCIHQVFMDQVAINPDKIAVVYQDEVLSFQQLYDKSHALALYLQSLGVKPDSLVGLCVERSLEMMVGILGILQAGGAYVPLDPDLPDDRLVYMLQDTQANIVLSQEKLTGKLSSLAIQDTQFIRLDAQWSEISESAADLRRKQVKLQQEVKPEHLAYVIYTSGSTGQPKGVMVEHKSVNRLVINTNFIHISNNDTFLQFASLSFDAATFEIWGALLNGAKLVIAPHGKNSIAQVGELIQTNNISVLWLTSGLFQLIVKDSIEQLSNIRVLLSGGDVVPLESARRFLEHYKNAIFINGYGPTESTTFTTCYVLSKGVDESLQSLPIGTPIANTQIYILDQHNNPQPIGVPGELHIAGDGLARGYLNRPELTEEKFIPNPFNTSLFNTNPFSTNPLNRSPRMYKSGDLVRRVGDINIEYLGRIDTQVKIRGFRIELGEIESRLNQYSEIKDSAVIALGKEGNKQLIAYYVARDTRRDQIIDLASEDLKVHLQQFLPDYMSPAVFVSLEVIPLTPNGKVDRRALESMDVNLESSQAYLAPRNGTEEQLVAIWAEVLDLAPEKIGVNDSFFELGGHSLLATQLLSRVRNQFAMDLPLKALFEQASIAGFAPLIMKAASSKSLSKPQSIIHVSRIDADGHFIESFPLSYAQERLWFIDQLEPDSAGYNIPGAVTISGELDSDHLELAFNLIIARHENLRTIFPSQEGQARQVILNRLDFPLERIDLSHEKTSEIRQQKTQQICRSEAQTPFDLARGPLIRGKLIRLTEQEHILMLNMHHIISDGWSMGVMVKEFSMIMDCLRQGQTPDQITDLPSLPIQYLDYSVWQRKWLGESRSREEGAGQGNSGKETLLEQQLAYWQEKLAGVPESLDLATDYPRPSVQSMSGAVQTFNLDTQLTNQLKSLAEQQGCTLFMTLLAAFKALLYRYTGQEDICLGSPIANRQYKETESLIGMFVNTLALRSQVEGEASFISLLSQVKTTCLDAYEHQDTPFEKIVDLVQPGRNMAISPLFQVMFILQNAPMESTEQHIQPYPLDNDVSKFDLTIEFTETRDGLAGSIEYRTSLYKQQTIERMAQNFISLCQAICTSPTAKISELEFISEAEKQQLLIGYNQTQTDYPQDKCIHQVFMDQVAIGPDKIAVVYQDQALSYQQLYDKSHALALYLQSLGVKPDSLVGLCVERSLEMMVGILGILQAGGAYVPLDPDYPKERLSHMLQDSQAAIVLSQEKLKDKLSALIAQDTQLIALDQQWSEIDESAADLRRKQVKLKQEVKPHHLAYVIYTSGSTGKSKGVAIEHHSPVALVYWAEGVYSRKELRGVLASTSISFDLSVYEIFLTLSRGGKVILASNILGLADLSNKESITLINTVPSAMEELLRLKAIPDSVETINLAGEPLAPALVDKIYANSLVTKVYDLYGPSEDTTYSTFILRERDAPQTIGRPISNTQAYILDLYNRPVPKGVPGELHLAGEGVARGYLNLPKLTDEKFIPNPFNTNPSNRSSRMYKSGDLVRWRDDGNIEYLGRIDSQVKIRGFRIETGEIESRLKQYPEIKGSVVIAQGKEGNKQLIAYYVARDTQGNQIIDLPNEALKAHLQQFLPDYMLPAAFVSLEVIPLTPNGKVDRRALESMDVNLESSQAYLAPRNATEEQLVAIWAEVLDLAPEKIGVNDNFFELGGHSLLATQLLSRVRNQFAIELPLKALFEQACIAGFAPLIVKAESSKSLSKTSSILPVSRTDADGHFIESFPLSYAQERLWFIDQLEPDSAGYNIPGAVTISGELDSDHLEQAFNLIIARHENLRTIFPSQEGQARQVILNRLDFPLERIDLGHYQSDEDRHEKARQLCQTEAAMPFNLACGPLIRGKLIRLTEQEHILMLNMHHIISDGWSMGVMVKEFSLIMDWLQQGQNLDKNRDLASVQIPNLPPLLIQYLDYSVWQRKWLGESRSIEERSRENHPDQGNSRQGNSGKESRLEQQLAYWQEKLAGVPESLDLATDYPRPIVQSMSGARQVIHLDAQLTSQLKSLAEQQGCTLFMTLLAVFKVLLYRYTGQEDICLGSPIANRQYGETESLIGMFVNTLALRSQIEDEESFIAFLAQVQTTCLDAYEHQDTPFEKIVDLVQPGRNMAISPLFQVMFILQNTPMESTEQHIQSYPLDNDISKFDLTTTFTETREGLEGVIAYKTTLYKSETIERMAKNFVALCRAIISTPTAKICDFAFIGKTEKQQLLIDYNQTQADYPQDKCIHQLFMDQVAINPEKIAVVYQDEVLSYQQLYDKSHALALYLQSLGVKPESLVGLCVERSPEMMVGILGILQAGGAYVPLDPDLPSDRLEYMLQDCRVDIVLSQEKLKGKLSTLVENETKLITLDKQWSEISESAADLRRKHVKLQQEVKPEHLAYVIYTSGSTGQPKGVMIEHKMVIDYAYSVDKKMGLGQCETFASLSTFSADLGNTTLFVPMVFGKTLHLMSSRYVNDPIMFKRYLDNHPIDCLKMTPSHFEMFKISDTEIVTGEKVLIFAGEPLSKQVVETVNTLKPGCKVFNNYGPTETTVAKLSTSELNSHDISSVNLGKPLNNTQLYILDRNNKPVPMGVPGELHIAGDGIARGYLNRPELTEEKFIPNPFNPQSNNSQPYNSGPRMYKTGDLVRWLSDGNIEYLGRIDTQVNIRGFRIETGEIEVQLNQHPEIKDCVVIAQSTQNNYSQGHHSQSNKQLIAYYVARDSKKNQTIQLTSDDLKTHLQQTLPEYMLPTAFVSLEAIPLTPNRKVDRRALESMNVNLESNQAYLGPRNATEKQLVAIWAEVLDLAPENIGVNDDFFDLGGHSLLAVRLMAKINSQFKQSLPLAILFSARSTATLAKLILSKKEGSFDVLVPIQTKGDKPPIFAVPGAGGNVLSFQALGQALGDKQPFYGLQAVGLDGKTSPLDSVEKTAKENVTAMQSIQPTGPYHLIGHSYGGAVAYEMARVLLEQNETIASLILLDSFAPSVIQKQKLPEEKGMFFEVCSTLANLYGLDFDLDIKQLQQISMHNRNDDIANVFNRHGIDITTEQLTTFYNVFKANRGCYLSYKPSKLSQKIEVSLYRASENHQEREAMPNDYGWSELLLKPIQIYDVNANHFSILDKDHILKIAKMMSD